MSRLRVSDHALVMFLERAGGFDVELLRQSLQDSLERASAAASVIGTVEYSIAADGLRYIIREGVVVTIEPLKTARREMERRP